MALKELSDGGTEGTRLGQSASDKVAFYGSSPVAQPAFTAAAVTAIGTTTLSQVGTSGKWAFASSTAGKALIARMEQSRSDVVAIRTALETLGLVSSDAS